MSKETGGAAFPAMGDPHTDNFIEGMTLLDFFAATSNVTYGDIIAIMSGNGVDIDSITVEQFAEYRARIKYAEARAMLKERYK